MKNKVGSSLLEIVVAVALVSTAILGSLALLNRSQKQTTYAKDLSSAKQYVSQAIDWVRLQRDTLGWSTLADSVSNTYCLSTIPVSWTDLNNPICDSTDVINATSFVRLLTLDKTNIASGSLKITVKVDWNGGTTSNEMELTKW